MLMLVLTRVQRAVDGDDVADLDHVLHSGMVLGIHSLRVRTRLGNRGERRRDTEEAVRD